MMDKKMSQITDSEWLIMKVLWEGSPLMNKDIIRMVGERSTWSSKTIETLLRRLVEKGAVGYRMVNAKNREYYPAFSQEECIRVESESFLKKVYDGSVSMMLAAFIKDKKLSREEIENLRKLIDSNEE